MSEESLPPEAANEQPSPKPADQSAAQPAKEANKSSEQKTDPADNKPAELSEANSEQRPPIKRNVRGAKKAAAKKEGKSEAKTDKREEGRAKEDGEKEGRTEDGKSSTSRERERGRGRGRQGKSQADEPKVKLDDKKVAKRAWKIFLGEVGEEGLALIADKDAREMARRSLRVAEIYSREEAALYKKKMPVRWLVAA